MSTAPFAVKFPWVTASAVGVAVVASALTGPATVPLPRQEERPNVVGAPHYPSLPASPNLTVRSFASVVRSDVPVVDPARLEVSMSKVAAIAALRDGWLGEGTLAPNASSLAWVNEHVALIASAPVPTSIIPDADGFLSLVWERNECEFTAEIHENEAHLLIDHLDSDEFEERVLPLSWADIRSAMVDEA